MSGLIRSLLIGFTLVAYVVLFFLFNVHVLPFTWLFFVFILSVGIKKYSTKQVLIILSMIITYPLAVFLLRIPLEGAIFLFIVYGLVYGYLLKGFWQHAWNKKGMVLALMAFILLTSTASSIFTKCDHVSAAEKGVSVSDIDFCKWFNLYSPPASNKFSGLDNWMVFLSITGPRNIALVLLLVFFYFYAKEKSLTYKTNSKNKTSAFIGFSMGVLFSLLRIVPFEYTTFWTVMRWINPFPAVFSWLMYKGDFQLYNMAADSEFGLITMLNIFITIAFWYLVGFYWHEIWKRKGLFFSIFALLMVAQYFMFRI